MAIALRRRIRSTSTVGEQITPEALWALRHRAFHIAIAILGQREQAEDVVQDVFVKALDHREPVLHLEAWLRTLIVRTAINTLRRPSSQSLETDVAEDGSFEDSILIRAALDKLSPETRVLLALAYVEGLTHKELADMLDIPEGTVASRLHAAKAAFHKEWNR
jgi:RNA polymerase sigma-70 factor, ECF subfamily